MNHKWYTPRNGVLQCKQCRAEFDEGSESIPLFAKDCPACKLCGGSGKRMSRSDCNADFEWKDCYGCK